MSICLPQYSQPHRSLENKKPLNEFDITKLNINGNIDLPYLYAADDKDTAFAIADGKGGVVFEVQSDGTTKGIDFKIDNGD